MSYFDAKRLRMLSFNDEGVVRGLNPKAFPTAAAFASLGRQDQDLIVRSNKERNGFQTAVERLSWLTPRKPLRSAQTA